MRDFTKILEPLIAVIIVVGIFCFAIGVMDTALARSDDHQSGCIYKSYAGIYNPFYRAGCELFRDRTFTE